ncbi:hypothetical protein WOLCODRAFT_163726 [Wolfiporia cocos MD-104 SS10]|uniref:Uncharacterized protein n=1 Tax=Wolfiporia cocos (strain MD-104) TaxID=742152 RepID=A0A2H3JKH3_WOLCO|nr:hypothetical protein WOLCODRAFT_163726 [Wolfiporia cocos MD-104 SS10]
MPQSSMATTNVQPFYGYVDTTEDALRLIEAARRGVLPRVTRRLNELERRSMIQSGSVFVFSVEESGIKRWTEGLAWSQSRISGNFLIYREVTDRSSLRSSQQTPDASNSPTGGTPADGHVTLKPNGLIKKTITVKINGSDHHLISYFTQEDVRSVKIPHELLNSANFRYPLKVESQHHASSTSPVDMGDEMDSQRRGILGSSSPTVRTPDRTLPHNASSLPHMDLSGLARTQAGSPIISYSGHGRPGQLDSIYSPRVHDEIGHSPTTPAYNGNIGTQSLEHISSSSWPPYPNAADSFAMGAGASAMYHNQLQLDHLGPVNMQRAEVWSQHPSSPSRIGRSFDQSVSRIGVGEHPELSPWSQSASAMTDQQDLASAPAGTTSISAQIPVGRGRDHMRTRSHPTVWHWDQNTAPDMYHSPPVSPHMYSSQGTHRSPR